MKNKKLILSFLWLIFFGFLIYKGYLIKKYNTVGNIRLKMEKHLKEKYNEDFVVLLSPIYSKNFLEGIIIPKRYAGTKKMIDPFYKTDIGIEINKIPILGITTQGEIYDGYPDILIKEQLERDTKKILEKNFGKNVLVALQLEGPCTYSTVKEEIEFRKRQKITDPLNGGIYIFGRVENEKDREKYRKGIYEFIQYLKQEGMFDYALLKIRVIDERVLTKGYRNNDNNIRENLIELANDKSLNRKEYSKKRVKLMSQFDEEYNKMTDKEKEEVMESYSKAALNKSYIKVFGKGAPLLSFFSYSPKYIISQGWNKDKNSDDYEEVKYYDKIEEVDLSEGW